MIENFKDKRGRPWEWFCDESYYNMFCVRPIGEREFNSELSFHFETQCEASAFASLLMVSS